MSLTDRRPQSNANLQSDGVADGGPFLAKMSQKKASLIGIRESQQLHLIRNRSESNARP